MGISLTATKDRIATRSELERVLWRWSGWQADQRCVDAVLETVDAYVRGEVQAARPICTRQHKKPPKPRPKRVVPPSVPEDSRICSRCRRSLPIAEFNRDIKSRNGHKAQCKVCEMERRVERERAKKQEITKEMQS
jgi:hypothetical protein